MRMQVEDREGMFANASTTSLDKLGHILFLLLLLAVWIWLIQWSLTAMSYPSIQSRLGNVIGVSVVGVAGLVLSAATLAYLVLIIPEAYRVTVSATDMTVHLYFFGPIVLPRGRHLRQFKFACVTSKPTFGLVQGRLITSGLRWFCISQQMENFSEVASIIATWSDHR